MWTKSCVGASLSGSGAFDLDPTLMQRMLPSSVVVAGASRPVRIRARRLRFKRFVDSDPRLCAQCHRGSPEFSLWSNGSHKSVACQRYLTPARQDRPCCVPSWPAVPQRVEGPRGCNRVLRLLPPVHDGNCPRWATRAATAFTSRKRGSPASPATPRGCTAPTRSPTPAGGARHPHRPARGMAKLTASSATTSLPGSGALPTRRDCLRCHRSEGVHPAHPPGRPHANRLRDLPQAPRQPGRGPRRVQGLSRGGGDGRAARLNARQGCTTCPGPTSGRRGSRSVCAVMRGPTGTPSRRGAPLSRLPEPSSGKVTDRTFGSVLAFAP